MDVTALETPGTRKMVRDALTRPYRVTPAMVLLVSLTIVYLVIAERAHTDPTARPELGLDRLIPLAPTWALVYGALYLFLILLPVLVLQDPDLIDRTVRAYLSVWLLSFVVFILYPTVAPRPEVVEGDGFAAWGLRFLYDSDPPYNCFPSLHVAHSFVSALACSRVHRLLGRFAMVCAAKFSLPSFSYHAILSSLNDAERTSTSPSPSTSVVSTHVAPSASVERVCTVKFWLPSFSNQISRSSTQAAASTSMSPSSSKSTTSVKIAQF